jgi:hypothetical protein
VCSSDLILKNLILIEPFHIEEFIFEMKGPFFLR